MRIVSYDFVNKQKDILLEAGQAMVNIIPLSERKIKIHCHLISLEEKNKREQNFGSTRGLKTHTKDLDFASLKPFSKG